MRSRRFFWHKGPMWENGYRGRETDHVHREIEDYLEANYSREDFLTSHNERFRRTLYDSTWGPGL